MNKEVKKDLHQKIDGYSILYKNEYHEENTDSKQIRMEAHQREWAEKIYQRWYGKLLELKKQKNEGNKDEIENK